MVSQHASGHSGHLPVPLQPRIIILDGLATLCIHLRNACRAEPLTCGYNSYFDTHICDNHQDRVQRNVQHLAYSKKLEMIQARLA